MNNTIDCNECFPNKPIPERAYVTLNKDKKNTDVDLFCVINKAIEQGLINVTNSTDTFSTLNNQVITFPDGQTLTVPSQADLNSLETQIQNNDTDIQNLQTELNNLSHPSIQSVDFKPTGNPNEYTIDLLWTDEDGNVNTVTDSTPVTITPSENAKSFTQINSTVIPNTPVDPTLTFDANQPLVEGTQVNQIYTDGVVTSTYNGAVWTNTITNREHKDGNILWVSTDGDDTAAQKGRMHSPYETISAAVAAATAGDTIHVLSGTYNLSTSINIDKSVTFNFFPNTILKLSGTNPIFNYLSGIDVNFKGKPIITHADGSTTVQIAFSLRSNQFTFIEAEFRDVQIMKWGTAFKSKQCIIDASNSVWSDYSVAYNSIVNYRKGFIVVQDDSLDYSSYYFNFNNTRNLTSDLNIRADVWFNFQGNHTNKSIVIDQNNSEVQMSCNGVSVHYLQLSGKTGVLSDSNVTLNINNSKFTSYDASTATVTSIPSLVGNNNSGSTSTQAYVNSNVTVNCNNSDIECAMFTGLSRPALTNNSLFTFNLENTKVSKYPIYYATSLNYQNTSTHVNLNNVKIGFLLNGASAMQYDTNNRITVKGKVQTFALPFIKGNSGLLHLKNLAVVFEDPTQTTALVVDNTSANPINVYCQSVSTNTLQDDPTVTEKLEPILRDANLK